MRIAGLTQSMLPVLALACLVGCKEGGVSDAVREGVEGVKEAVSQTTEAVKEHTSLAGSIELTVDKPLKTGRCYLALVSLTSGRPGILQMTSYQNAGDESFPSVFFRAEVSAAELAELVGQEVAGQLYVQAVKDGPVWHSADDRPVRVAITSAADGSIEGEVRGGDLVNTDTGQSNSVTGKFAGSLQ